MRILVALVAAVLTLSPRPLRAEEEGGDLPSDPVIGVLLVSELLIPDLRLQLRKDERLVLSWPVHLLHFELRRSTELTPFVEPQYQTSTSDLRAVAGARFAVMGQSYGGLIEGGAVFGHDFGTGGVVGLGAVLGIDGRSRPGVALVARATFLRDEQRRFDVALDVTMATVADLFRVSRR